jgi:hypothetical protein
MKVPQPTQPTVVLCALIVLETLNHVNSFPVDLRPVRRVRSANLTLHRHSQPQSQVKPFSSIHIWGFFLPNNNNYFQSIHRDDKICIPSQTFSLLSIGQDDGAWSEEREEREALQFLVKYMPAHDRRSIPVDFLVSNVKLALQVQTSDRNLTPAQASRRFQAALPSHSPHPSHDTSHAPAPPAPIRHGALRRGRGRCHGPCSSTTCCPTRR